MKRLRIRQRAEWKQSLPDLTWPRSLKVTFSNSWFCATKSFKGPIYWISSDIKQLKTPNPHILKAALASQMTVLIAKMYLKVLLVRKVNFFHLNLNYDPSYDELVMRLFLPSKAAVSVVIVLANFLSILQSSVTSIVFTSPHEFRDSAACEDLSLCTITADTTASSWVDNVISLWAEGKTWVTDQAPYNTWSLLEHGDI